MDGGRPRAATAEIGRALEAEARAGVHIARELCGHGPGRGLHDAPEVPNYYNPRTRGTLTEGLVLAVEPMLTAAPARLVEAPDR